MVSLSEFLESTRAKAGAFQPHPLYTPEGDSLTFYLKDEDSYGERIDELLTVYKSCETDEIVGCQIKGVRRKLRELQKFMVTLKDPKLDLGLLFLTYMATSDSKTARHKYEWLGEQAARLKAAVPTKDLLPG
jgi:hypothetical protein